jgi:hypothetical protein
MKPAPREPHGALTRLTANNESQLLRSAKTGAALRLAPGLYAVGATLPPEQVARHHMHAITAHYWPGGVLCGRSAVAGGIPDDGNLFVAHPEPVRKNKVRLPGLVLWPVRGPGPLPGDMELPEGLYLSGPARVLVENVDVRGRPARQRAGTEAVEDRIDGLARSGGAGRVQGVLDQLDVIAGSFPPAAVEAVRQRLVAVLGTATGGFTATSGRLAARLDGAPFDGFRVQMVEDLVDLLERRAPSPLAALPPLSRWEWLAFFEAYFSNFIEGTEFGVDEARRIVVDGVIPAARPADAHDVSATYRLAVSPTDRVLVPANGDDLIDILKARHRTLMAVRQDKRPGEFKEIMNYAGGYQFVEPALVAGTLQRGFAALDRLHSPLARATAMMLLVTECHPFDDGNGRVARLTANAELSAAGEVRVLVPIIMRNDYIAGLSGVSRDAGPGQPLIAVLEHLQRWAAAVDWSTYEGAGKTLTECNAYLDAGTAASQGHRLLFPS